MAVWDIQENRLAAEIPRGSAVSWLGFTPGGLALVSVNSMEGHVGDLAIPANGGGFRLIPLGDVKLAAVHPSGEKLVAVDSLHRLMVVSIATGFVDREINAPFGAEASRRYFESPRWHWPSPANERNAQDLQEIRLAARRRLVQGIHGRARAGLWREAR